jgi:hypothetical protein
LQSNGSVNRGHYLRILALACIDILLTLPLGVISVTIELLLDIHDDTPGLPFRFYNGWVPVHSNWGPIAVSYPEIMGTGVWNFANVYFSYWTSPILAIAIFALFGLTSEARATYWREFCTVAKHFGWTPPALNHEHKTLGEIQFVAQQLTVTRQCVLRLFASTFSTPRFCFRSHPSFVVSQIGRPDVEQRYGFNQWVVFTSTCADALY